MIEKNVNGKKNAGGMVNMKIRNGFVSNSSSSSFMVSCSPGEQHLRISIELNLENYGKKITSIEELHKDVTIEELVENGECMMEDLEEAIQKGKMIIVGDFSDEDGPEEYVLCYKGLEATDFQGRIIHNEPGY